MALGDRERLLAAEFRRRLEAALGPGLVGLTVFGSRYYSCLHAARALLLAEGLEPATHSGVRSEIHRLYVTGGELSRATARILADLQALREDADYSREVEIQGADAEAARLDALEFLTAVRELLSARGFPLSPLL